MTATLTLAARPSGHSAPDLAPARRALLAAEFAGESAAPVALNVEVAHALLRARGWEWSFAEAWVAPDGEAHHSTEEALLVALTAEGLA